MRPLLSAVAGAILALTTIVDAASAQQEKRVYRIGWLWLGTPGRAMPPFEEWKGPWAAFREVMRDHGYVAGKNYVVDVRHAHGDVARLVVEAESLVASGVDVIITLGTPPTFAVMQATKRIPIVFAWVGDPVEKELVASLGRPGGNVTGMATLIAYPKLWQLLHEVSPSIRCVGVVSHTQDLGLPADRAAAFRVFSEKRWGEAAAAAGVRYIRIPLSSLDEVDSRFAELAACGEAGIILATGSILIEWRSSLMEMAIKHRLISGCPQQRVWAEAGCLVTYTEDYLATPRGVGIQVIRILKGANPADIPVEQPMSGFKIIVNARTAKSLDLTLPQTLVAAADEVIE